MDEKGREEGDERGGRQLKGRQLPHATPLAAVWHL